MAACRGASYFVLFGPERGLDVYQTGVVVSSVKHVTSRSCIAGHAPGSASARLARRSGSRRPRSGRAESTGALSSPTSTQMPSSSSPDDTDARAEHAPFPVPCSVFPPHGVRPAVRTWGPHSPPGEVPDALKYPCFSVLFDLTRQARFLHQCGGERN